LVITGVLLGRPVLSADFPPFDIGNREEPDEIQLAAFAKHFLVEMRRSSDGGEGRSKADATRLRK
jgi:hypothetical protein